MLLAELSPQNKTQIVLPGGVRDRVINSWWLLPLVHDGVSVTAFVSGAIIQPYFGFLCATSVSSVSRWFIRVKPTQRHGEHRGCTEKSKPPYPVADLVDFQRAQVDGAGRRANSARGLDGDCENFRIKCRSCHLIFQNRIARAVRHKRLARHRRFIRHNEP